MWIWKWGKKEKPSQDKMVSLLCDHQEETVSHDKVTSWVISENERVCKDLLEDKKRKTNFRYPPQEWDTPTRFEAMNRLCKKVKERGIRYDFGKVNSHFVKEA